MTTTDAPTTALLESDRRDWQRHSVDGARLIVRLCLLGLVLFLTAVLPSALTNASADVVSFFARMPEPLRYALVGLAQLTILVVPIVIVGWLLVRRTRAATLLVIGAAVVGGTIMLLLTDWLERAAPPTAITDLPSGSFVSASFPSAAYLAALVAGASAASPMMTTRWRRIAWSAVWVTVLVRLTTATQAPVNLFLTLALGSAIGSAALVIFGSPQRRPGAATLRAALAAGGFHIDELGDESVDRGARSYHGRAGTDAVDVVYLDRDDRDVELFARVVRSIRVRDVDEQRISVRPRIRAAQLTQSIMMAQRAGARVQEVLAVAPTGTDSSIIVMGAASTAGTTLRQLTDDGVSDAALDDAWRQLGLLHRACMAHRSLTRDNVVVEDDLVTLLGLDTALLASSAESRDVDRAELLVSTALTVGVDRALDAAVRSVAADDLESTLPFVQRPALPARTREDAKKPKHLVDDLRSGLEGRLGVEQVELAELERVSFGKIVTWVGFAVLAFFVLTLVTNWSAISDAMAGIDWVWVIPAVIATLVGTVGGAMSLAGSVVRPIPLGDATVVMFGQSFLNRFTPMNAGGMAMRIRYLQKGGTDVAVSTAAVGLTSLASGVVQVAFIVFFFLWSSTDPTGDVDSGGGGGPDLTLVFVFVGAILVAAIVLALTPKFRRWLVALVKSTIEKVRHDFGELLRMPSKLSLLFGGQVIAKMSTILAFVWACRAFGIDLPFAELGALYLAANTVASTVPTPGGVGAIEAALVFVLTRAGVPDAEAWAATLLFRLINYWLPTIPGYIALRYSERHELV
ncbi:MAG: flippase-like domain-containing protein [Acidimicrobiales bacterium]|nr:MAG: flippase-like domain-containing protein [Acidimicrobiales bacterium]